MSLTILVISVFNYCASYLVSTRGWANIQTIIVKNEVSLYGKMSPENKVFNMYIFYQK